MGSRWDLKHSLHLSTAVRPPKKKRVSKKGILEAAEMAQQLGFQSVSTEDPKSVPRTQVRYCNSDALFWTLQASVSSWGHNSPPLHTHPKKTHKRNKSLKERKRFLIVLASEKRHDYFLLTAPAFPLVVPRQQKPTS